jgi:hypothetical protein
MNWKSVLLNGCHGVAELFTTAIANVWGDAYYDGALSKPKGLSRLFADLIFQAAGSILLSFFVRMPILGVPFTAVVVFSQFGVISQGSNYIIALDRNCVEVVALLRSPFFCRIS